MSNNMEKEIFDIYVDDIIPNRFQPRLTFDETSLKELAESIKQHGVIQPLVVRKIGDKYEIIAGERRYKASQIAGLQKVPAVIMNLDDQQSAEVAVVENIQRKDLSALEEAESYKKLLDKGYLTQEQLATRMGKNQSTISNKLRLLGLQDEVKQALLNQKISERHARSLLSLKDQDQQKEVLNKIISNKLTVRQTDDLIKSMISDNVETLDFTSTSVGNVPIESMVTENNNENIDEFIESPISQQNIDISTEDAPNFDPISNIDVNQIKKEAVDINPVRETANVNALLGVENEAAKESKIIPTAEVEKTRFIPIMSDDDEEDDEEINIPSMPVEKGVNPIPEPKTYTDSLVQEFRQNNAATDTRKIIPGNIRTAVNAVREITQKIEEHQFKIDVEEFDFEQVYQIIIKINK